jgi:hypothetical protein
MDEDASERWFSRGMIKKYIYISLHIKSLYKVLYFSIATFVVFTLSEALDPFVDKKPSTIRGFQEMLRFEDPKIITPPYDSS